MPPHLKINLFSPLPPNTSSHYQTIISTSKAQEDCTPLF
jgi:hypothetical protein